MPGLKPMASLSDPSGKVAVLFAIILVPILFSVGFAIDAAQQVNAGKRVQYAVDAAALAGARALENGEVASTEVEAITLKSFYANIGSAHAEMACRKPAISVDREESTVELDATCDIPSVFGVSMMGKGTLGVSRSSAAQIELSSLDVAMMLDISNSMRGQKVEDLKDAANTLVTSLLGDNSGDRVRISLIPYATSVNSGRYGNLAMGRAWDDDRFGDGVDIVCIREREGSQALTDASPAPGRWVEELTDPNERCEESELLPLTNDMDAIQTAIEDLEVRYGATSGHLAVAWSWYTLSPAWSGIWPTASRPLDYDSDDGRKVVIIMSDGAFNKRYSENVMEQLKAVRDAKDLCEAMKAKNIEIYSIGYQIPEPTSAPGSFFYGYSAEITLRSCASGTTYFMNAGTPEELKRVYGNIATRLRNLKVTR